MLSCRFSLKSAQRQPDYPSLPNYPSSMVFCAAAQPLSRRSGGVQFETQCAGLHLFDASLPAEQEAWRTETDPAGAWLECWLENLRKSMGK